jgi:hypothetical protein
MARQFLTGLNLNKNELLNARIQNLATDPNNGVEGQVYYNTAAHEMRVYNGTIWEAVGLNGVTADASEINILDGATITTAELNILDGVTADYLEINILDGALVSTTELNYLVGATSNVQAQINAKAPISNPVFTGDVTVVSTIVFEGATANDFETTLTVTDPTADRTITLPDASGTVILSTDTVNALSAPTSAFSMNSQKITNLATPTDATDAATKGYVDAARSGLDVKQSVRVATTAADENIDLTTGGTLTIDGVVTQVGDRVLVKNQSTASQNGIYVVAANAWSRSTDADSNEEVTAGLFTFVTEGTANADSGWVLSTDDTITLGTTGLTFVQFSGAGQITAGAGLTKTGNTIDVVGTADRITVNADSVDIAATYVGQNTITTLGTIATGTWNGTTIAVANGGTGATTAADARTNLGATTKYTAANPELTPASGSVSWTVTHNLGIRTVLVQLYDLSTYETVEVDVVRTNTTTVTLSWNAAATVAASAYQVVIVG